MNKIMKKIIFLLGIFLCALHMNAVAKVDKIEPTDWFVGMKNPSLQLMVYGKNIREAEFSVDYPGVRVDSVVRLDSPNYLLVYLNVKDAKTGIMKL